MFETEKTKSEMSEQLGDVNDTLRLTEVYSDVDTTGGCPRRSGF